MVKNKKEEDKQLWHHTRIGFYTMLTMWLVATFLTAYYDTMAYIIFSIAWVGVTIFTFVCSIRHLKQYKKKGLALTSLIISGILTFLFLIGFIAGAISAIGA